MRPFAALLLCAAVTFAQESDCVSRVYDVRALIQAEQDRPGPRLELGRGGPRRIEDGVEYFPAFDGETLTSLLENLLGPDAWSADGASMDLAGGWLEVRQTAALHARIAAVLGVLARAGSRRAVVDAHVVLLAPGMLEEAGAEAGVLSEAQDRALREAAAGGKRGRTVGVLRVAGLPGVLGHAAEVRQRRLLTDFDIEIAMDSVVADPVSRQVLDGTVLEIRPCFAPDGATILVDYRFSCARPGTVREFDGKTKPEGKFQLPSRGLFTAGGTWPCPSGRTVLLVPGGVTGIDEGWTLAVLLQARRVEEPMGDLATGTEGVKLRLLEAGALTASFQDAWKRTVDLPPVETTEVVADWVEDPDCPGIDTEALAELIRRETGEDAWAADGVSLVTQPGRVLVTASEPLLDATETCLKALAKPRLRRAAVDVAVVAVDAAHRGSLPASDLLALARKGETARVVARASALGLPGQRAAAFAGAESLFVRDRDVEIAQGAGATDPVSDVFTEGLALNARPFEPEAGGRARVELEAQFGWRAKLEPAGTGTAPGGDIDRTSIELLEARCTMGLNAGEWTVAAEAAREGAEGRTECLVLLVRVRFPEVR